MIIPNGLNGKFSVGRIYPRGRERVNDAIYEFIKNVTTFNVIQNKISLKTCKSFTSEESHNTSVTTIVISLVILGVVQAAPKTNDSRHDHHHHVCQEFTKGQVFNDSQALGTWHLLHFKTEKTKGSGESHCVEFSPVTVEDRTNLQDLIGKYVENMKWENLTLKMQIPCTSINSNKTRDYYLERLEGDGSYRTLQKPLVTAKLDLTGFNRYPMRLKIIENDYLGMMDCHEKFMFLLGKQPPENKVLDERLTKMIEAYWPEEF